MRSLRTRSSAFVVLALVLLLVAQLLAGTATAQGSEKTLRVAQSVYPFTLDPNAMSFINEGAVFVLGYEGLTRLDENLETVPAAAERWSFSDDGLRLTFELRDGLTYSDGSPLTAQRFADAVVRSCDPRTGAPYAYVLFVVVGCQELFDLGAETEATPIASDSNLDEARSAVGVEALDDQTLEIHLTAPASYFPTVAATWVFFPVKQELIAAGGAEWPFDPANHVGNRPFTITELEDQKLISFRANEHYWAGRPKLDGINYIYGIEDGFEAYQAGTVDIVGVDSAQLATARADPDLSKQVVTYPQAFTSTFQFNLKKEPFTDKKVREAFSYAFDCETWCNEVLQGVCNPTQAWIPEGIPGHVPTDSYGFDPEKARDALAASSYGSGANLPEIDVVYIGGDPAEQENMEWVASQYLDILGVELTLVPVEFDAWAEMTGSNETYPSINTLGGWGQDYPDPQNWLSLVYACDTHFAQAIGYCNEEFDALIEQADQEFDPAKRLALYEEANRILIADAVAVIHSNSQGNFLVKPNVTGLSPTPSDFGFPGQFASLLDIDLTT